MKSGPIVYGILLAGFGTGAFIAGMSNGFLRRITSQNRLVAFAFVACAACCVSVALTSSVPVAAVALALGGAGWLITWTGIDVAVQLASPRWVVGRTLSIYYALSAGGMAAGSWIWGSVAQNYSLTWALEGAAGVCCCLQQREWCCRYVHGKKRTRKVRIFAHRSWHSI
ncbi:hypothetical protein X759_33360 [Mesorhizobium sp. LSHC420B00]|nr:hypothetical protein X759_33360 [Mesorhizobium sp. LSHC420B00]